MLLGDGGFHVGPGALAVAPMQLSAAVTPPASRFRGRDGASDIGGHRGTSADVVFALRPFSNLS